MRRQPQCASETGRIAMTASLTLRVGVLDLYFAGSTPIFKLVGWAEDRKTR